jgi:hypothetical protein
MNTTRRFALVGTTVAAALLVGAFMFGRASAQEVDWHTGVAQFGAQQMSATIDGWTYGVVESVPAWTDSAGVMHRDGWPDCFRVPAGTRRVARFATVPVDVRYTQWQQDVMVDCQGTAPASP